MNTRRKMFIALAAGALAVPFTALGQQKQRVYRVGILSSGSLSSGSQTFIGHLIEAFLQGLRELGYVEGTNVLIERRFAEGHLDRLPALAADLVQQKVDVIFVAGSFPAQPAKQATRTIPIVFSNVHDPVGMGLVASLARPGGNMTGTSNIASELSAKRLELLKEAYPNISRVAVIVPSDAFAAVQFAEVQGAAKVLRIEALSVEVRDRDDFERAATLLRQWRADSIFVVQSPTNLYKRKLLAEFAAKMRLPSVGGAREFADAGHILSYGANLELLYQQAATYVDKILKGAKPSELPVEQPTKFELVINMKAAKALGLTIPHSVLLRADKVIE